MNRAQSEALVREHERLALTLAARYATFAERADLDQVARIGLWQAARRFDPTQGCLFSTFAVRTVLGELQHYVRDCTLSVRVSRDWWDLGPRLVKARETLMQTLDRAPTAEEIAEHLGAPLDHVNGSLTVWELLQPLSLDEVRESADGGEWEVLVERLAGADGRTEAEETRLVLQMALAALDAVDTRLRQVLELRYWEDLTQTQTGRIVGCSQMNVCRLEKRALAELRTVLAEAFGGGEEGAP